MSRKRINAFDSPVGVHSLTRSPNAVDDEEDENFSEAYIEEIMLGYRSIMLLLQLRKRQVQDLRTKMDEVDRQRKEVDLSSREGLKHLKELDRELLGYRKSYTELSSEIARVEAFML